MSALVGNSVGGTNYRLRFLVILLMGVMAFGGVLWWRSQVLFASDYVEFPSKALHHNVTLRLSPQGVSAHNKAIEDEMK